MSHRETCSICEGNGFVRRGEDEYSACICLARDRARAAIDRYPALEGVKPFALPTLRVDRSLRIHGLWEQQLRGHLAHAIGTTRITEGRRLEIWMVSSAELRTLHIEARVPEHCSGKDLVIVRLSQSGNRIVGAALGELLSAALGPVWIVTSPPERPLVKGHPAWTPDASPLISTLESVDLAGEPDTAKAPSVMTLIGLESGGKP